MPPRPSTPWIFRPLTATDFRDVRRIAHAGWRFAYGHYPASRIAQLVEDYYSETALTQSIEAVADGRALFDVACRDGVVVGYCHVRYASGAAAELLRLYIEPTLIGRGLGHELMTRSERFLITRGIQRCYCYVNRHNTVGLAFYKRHGFAHQPAHDRADEFEPGALLYLTKTLQRMHPP